MKTRNFLLAALALFVTATGFATQLPAMYVIPIENEKALVAFESLTPAVFELSLTNDRGETVYYKKSEMPAKNHKVILNLENLDEGNYHLSLKHGNCMLDRQISLANGKSVSIGEEFRAFSPYIKYENNILRVSYLNSSEKNVYLAVYKDGKTVTGKKLGKDLAIQKAVDFSRLEQGNYDVVLSNNKSQFQFTVQK